MDDEEISEVIKTIKNGSLTSSSFEGGKNVQDFENKVSSFVKSKYAVAVNSGTSALQASLLALNIQKGDEVLVPSFTFVATANAVVSVGAKPVFVDILRENFTIDPNNIKQKISKKTKAIIPVHLYGNVAFMEEILEISEKNNLKIIEDSSQSLGSTFKRKHTGTFSDLGCFSMYPSKVMTSGEGGFIVTDKKNLRDKLRMIRNHGIQGNNSKILGLNLRLPEINAAIAKIQMKKLPAFLKQRKKNALYLSNLISNFEIKIPTQRKHESVNWYLYTISIPKRKKILSKLQSQGIGATTYYNKPIHQTQFYKEKIKLPETEWASSHVLSLPIHPKVTRKNIEHIAKILGEEICE